MKSNIRVGKKKVGILKKFLFWYMIDRNICYQLKNYLTMGSNEYLLYEAMKKLSHTEIRKPKYVIYTKDLPKY